MEEPIHLNILAAFAIVFIFSIAPPFPWFVRKVSDIISPMQIFANSYNQNRAVKLVLIFMSGLGAHLFAITTYKMFDYWMAEGGTYGNLTDLSIVAGTLLLVGVTGFALRSLHVARHASDILIYLGFFALTAFQWFALAVHHFLDHHELPLAGKIVVLVVPPLMVVLAFWFNRLGVARVAVVKQEVATPVEGLAVFLSFLLNGPPGQFFTHENEEETELWKGLKAEIKKLTDGGSIKDKALWTSFGKKNWRMPISAIGHQFLCDQPRLRKVIVIASKDSSQGKGSGSARQFEFFRETVRELCNAAGVAPPEVVCLKPEGIDFEDCDAISAAVQQAKDQFAAEKIVDYLVDITGGTSLCSATAAVLTLDADEAFQYVSTNDFSIKEFDLEYEPRRQPMHR